KRIGKWEAGRCTCRQSGLEMRSGRYDFQYFLTDRAGRVVAAFVTASLAFARPIGLGLQRRELVEIEIPFRIRTGCETPEATTATAASGVVGVNGERLLANDPIGSQIGHDERQQPPLPDDFVP